MRCAHCLRPIHHAYYMQAGRTYGPTCGKRLGLDIGLAAALWNSPVTKYKPRKMRTDWRSVVQPGQQPLFEGLTA